MNLHRSNGSLYLQITGDFRIAFQDEWVEHLRTLPYERFGEFMRGTIYKTLTPEERAMWNKSKISNRDLLEAIQNPK